MLRVAVCRESAYLWAQHLFLGRDAGLTDEEMGRIAFGPEAPFFAPLETALIRSVDELIDDGAISEATWTTLAAELDAQQLLDVVFTVGCYNTVAWFFRSFDLEVDPEIPDLLMREDRTEETGMARRTRYSEYKDRYANYKFELSDDGILFMQCHTNGGSLVWDWNAHDEMSDAFADIAGDREIKVLIHTGTGENYNADWGRLPNGELPETPIYDAMPGVKGLRKLDEKAWYGRMLILNVLDVDVPMISAVNGPCNIHSEVPLMGDIVLASEDAYFQDLVALPAGHGAGRRSARDLELPRRPQPRPLLPAHGQEARVRRRRSSGAS